MIFHKKQYVFVLHYVILLESVGRCTWPCVIYVSVPDWGIGGGRPKSGTSTQKVPQIWPWTHREKAQENKINICKNCFHILWLKSFYRLLKFHSCATLYLSSFSVCCIFFPRPFYKDHFITVATHDWKRDIRLVFVPKKETHKTSAWDGEVLSMECNYIKWLIPPQT